MPSQTFSDAAVAPVPIDVAWAAMDRPETWERIGGVDRVLEPRHDEMGRLQGFTFETTIGGRPYRGIARPGERIEGERITWLIVSPDLRGSIDVGLAEADDGTRLDLSLTVAVDGLLGSMFFPMVVQALGRGFPQAVENFAASLGGHSPAM